MMGSTGSSNSTSAGNHTGTAPPPPPPPCILPSSAPVSSLLPPLPTSQQQQLLLQQHFAASIQVQIAALLRSHATAAAAVVPPPLPVTPALVPTRTTNHRTHSHTIPPSTTTTLSPWTPMDMHGWSVEQIEKHMEMLRQLQHDIPPKMTLVWQAARKRADQRHAKRLANRQSACTSRARKKALVETMTALNARLKRQALILSLLPDLVICMDTAGTITFCSAQVERCLQHAAIELVGAKLSDILEPGPSRDALSRLIQGWLAMGVVDPSTNHHHHVAVSLEEDDEEEEEDNKAARHNKRHHGSMTKKKQSPRQEDNSYDTSGPRTVTETFPLSVVLPTTTTTRSDDHSDATSHDKPPSSLTGNSVAGGHSGSDDPAETTTKPASTSLTNPKNSNKTLSKEDTSISQSSDASNTSSSHTDSSNAKNLLSANANLERNVRQHNQKIMSHHKRAAAGYKDDVIGAAVTANNASARLSSLAHLRSAESSEEDSGYRQSNDSREETSSSSEGETPSQRNGARRPKLVAAPTVQVCLIRKDGSTLWCEVTSSLRTTKDAEDDDSDARTTDDASVEKVKAPLVQEILLCLRPIREGAKADEAHRFQPRRPAVSDDAADEGGPPTKKCRTSHEDEMDTAVVESLMSMSNPTNV